MGGPPRLSGFVIPGRIPPVSRFPTVSLLIYRLPSIPKFMVSDVHQNTAPKDNVKETSVQFLGDARSDSDTTAAGPTALTMAGTPIVRRKRRASSSEETTRDYASPSPDAQRPSTKQQVRHRASVACASCRERRIRCVVPEGQAECTQCSRTGISCIIKNDDERRRYVLHAKHSWGDSNNALGQSPRRTCPPCPTESQCSKGC